MNQAAPKSTTTAVANVTTTRADVYVGEVLPPDRMEALVASLPAHVKPERFQRNLVIAITQQPDLLNCDPAAVFNEVSKAGALGLYLDPQLGEAYLIAGWDSRQNRKVPQLRVGYRGLQKLGRQSGDLLGTPYAHEVCANDHFRAVYGAEKHLEHEPDFDSDRGDVRLFYAVVKFRDGEVDFEVMNIPQIERIRERSDGWRAFKAGKIKSTPWSTDFEEMAKKTVLRRLMKRIPQSPELADAMRVEDNDYSPEEAPAPLSLVDRLKSRGKAGGEGFSQDHVLREIEGPAPPNSEADGEDEQDGYGGPADDPDDPDDIMEWKVGAERDIATATTKAGVDEMFADWTSRGLLDLLKSASKADWRDLCAAGNGRAAELERAAAAQGGGQ